MADAPNITTLYQGALDVAYQNPLLYQIDVHKAQAETALANNLAYWKQIYPAVELRAIDNPGVDYRLFDMAWQSAWGNPPLVFLHVTPRKKPLPETGGILQDVAVFAPLIALIPVVGQVAALAISVASAADQAGKVQEFFSAMASVTNSQFEPQYFPQPFPVLLPLDKAQLAVREPWQLPRLWDTFKLQIQELQRQATQQLIGQPSTLTLSPELHPEVVGVAPPGTTPLSRDSWYKNLLASFGREADPALEYQRLQNVWLTGDEEGWASQSAPQGTVEEGSSKAGVFWLALLGAGALIAGSR